MNKLFETINSFIKEKNITNYIFISFSVILIIICIAISYIFLLSISKYYAYDIPQLPPDMSVTGQVGDFIGGTIGTILAFISVLFLFITLRNQRISNSKERFENNFFELLKLYRDNVAEIEIPKALLKNKNYPKLDKLKGRSAFDEIHNLMLVVYLLCKDYCKEKQIDINVETELPNIAYLIVFFGTDDILNKNMISKATLKITDKHPNLIKELIENLEQKSKASDDKRMYVISGIHEQFGHYFRHLYQTVNYVDDNKLLTFKEKYFYVKMLRSQMGDYEQSIFFFNSLSDLGKKWELGEHSKKLISKYKIIKNLPDGLTFVLDPKKFYPECFMS
ncbi:MAG: hypothetical protein HOO91_21115 [Bacteroidales bacterium]|nr:hypothetical protein [Bacteroidales bacterium]